MKVKDLKKLLESIPDDMLVVVSGSDHSYFKVGMGTGPVQAEVVDRYHLSQYYDERNKSNPDNKVIEVFWIDDGRY